MFVPSERLLSRRRLAVGLGATTLLPATAKASLLAGFGTATARAFGMTAMGDEYWNSVTLLTATGGTNGSTTFTDLSKSATTVSPTNMAYDNTNLLAGQNTAHFTGSSTGTRLALPANYTGLVMGTGDFTIEGFYFTSSNAANQDFYASDSATSAGWLAMTTESGQGGKPTLFTDVGNPTIQSSIVWPLNAFNHWAITRAAGAFTIWQNGASGGSATPAALNMTAVAPSFCGQGAPVGDNRFAMWMGQIRVTKGVCRYNTTFTPPSVPFPAH